MSYAGFPHKDWPEKIAECVLWLVLVGAFAGGTWLLQIDGDPRNLPAWAFWVIWVVGSLILCVITCAQDSEDDAWRKYSNSRNFWRIHRGG